MFDLKGHKALVTGSGQGMGVGIARSLGQAGATVYINDLFSERAEAVVEELRSEGIDAHVKAFDVTSLEAFEKAVGEIGMLDILVSNAGIVPVKSNTEHFLPFAHTNPDTWHRQFDLNVFGVMNGIRAVLPGMREKGRGRIITISTDGGRKGTAGLSIYGASKAAGMQLTKSVAVEEGGYGITANTVSLGLMENAASTHVSEEINALFSSVIAQLPVSRAGRASDVGSAVSFLASDQAEWITGQNLPVNGGGDTF